MDATAWTVVGTAIAILVAIATAFRSLRGEVRLLHERIDTQGARLGERVDAQGKDLRERIDAQGEDLRKRFDAQGEQLGLLRERMAHLEGLLEGLREAITGKRVA